VLAKMSPNGFDTRMSVGKDKLPALRVIRYGLSNEKRLAAASWRYDATVRTAYEFLRTAHPDVPNPGSSRAPERGLSPGWIPSVHR